MANDKPQSPSLEDIRRYIQRWGEEPLAVHRLRSNVYWADGAGGNSGIVVGRHGVIVIDAKVCPDAGKRLLEEVARITSNPVTHVILTHGDGDHVMGLARFPAGLTIIAHEKCKSDMQAANATGLMGTLPSAALPNHTFTASESLTLEGVRFELLHFGPSHTGGDAVIYLPDQKVIFSGDILAWGGSPTPTIHEEKHGSAIGWLTTVREMLKLPADTFVTGHGDVQTKSEVQQKLDQFQKQYDEIKAMIARGKSLDEVEEAMAADTTAPPAGGLRLPSFASVAYHQLTRFEDTPLER
ncbi:MBL fold metallo-hydrolase [Rhizobium sp. CB3090]|uniref:MBL fold metallo-hydrolase n=1 Tax=Rhizobium sp. CB3090 TaxID=3039156 RepID=UPI0024B076AF|nr:MBL fold metallo-hydrolase [Rhizobium sp. CB3090]WFU10335.1 MBL fold metallo-hydrolase [Rhizobium sp. CB3090]